MTGFACSHSVYPLVKVSPWDDVRMPIVDETEGPVYVL